MSNIEKLIIFHEKIKYFLLACPIYMILLIAYIFKKDNKLSLGISNLEDPLISLFSKKISKYLLACPM